MMKRKKRKLRKRMTRHHLIPKSRGGSKANYNLLILDWDRHHKQWHALFGNRTIFEVIEVLKRIVEVKHFPIQFGDGTSQ
jgi:5-methylcytosine-specific restriction endonuclease McrA